MPLFITKKEIYAIILLSVLFTSSIFLTDYLLYRMVTRIDKSLCIQKEEISTHKKEVIKYTKKTDDIIELFKFTVIPVSISAYPPLEEHTDSTPRITASGKKVNVKYIALSKPLEKDFNLKFGDEVIVAGIGKFKFYDRMSQTRWKDYRVDIFMWEKKACLDFGRKDGFLIIPPKKVKKNVAKNTLKRRNR